MTTDYMQDVILKKKKISIFSRPRRKDLALTQEDGFVNGHDDIFEVLSKRPTSNDYTGYRNV